MVISDTTTRRTKTQRVYSIQPKKKQQQQCAYSFFNFIIWKHIWYTSNILYEF